MASAPFTNPENDQNTITLEQGQPRADITEKVQFYSSVLGEGSGEPAPVNSDACVCTKSKEDLKKLLVRIQNNRDDQFPRKVYPKRDVYNTLTADVAKRLVRCPCSNCRCDKSLPLPQDEIVDIITSDFRLILAILLLMDKVYLLQGFVDKNYTDERVLQEPPSPEDLEDLAVRFFSQWKIPTRFHDPHFQSEFHFDFQPQLILPDLPACGGTTTFTGKCNLPLDLGELIGSGGYGDVFKARILDGYHSFETKNGYVAVKIYRDSTTTEGGLNQPKCQSSPSGYGDDYDFQLEKRNNERFHHPNIIPMWAAIKHGAYNMAIYPLARTSLDKVMKEPCTLSFVDIVSRMVDLSSALALMHCGVPETCGYHFDIKPSNILARYDGTWVLADLGAAHFKKAVMGDPSYSATRRPPCADEFAAPDGNTVRRSFDVWSLGCVFALLLVWFAEGPDAVARFRDSRKTKVDNRVSHSFHEMVGDTPMVKLAVWKKFDAIVEQHADNRLLIESIKIVRLLLNPQQAERPTSKQAEELLSRLLGEEGKECNAAILEPAIED